MFLGRDKQPGAGCLVGGLGCQAVGLSVRQGQPGAAARSWVNLLLYICIAERHGEGKVRQGDSFESGFKVAAEQT